ncbi:MAG: CBS domain-containing protein [Lachnospiraceae bacterium]|nr:CBS domain-containing protein [Lachnospiraceae bacterium]
MDKQEIKQFIGTGDLTLSRAMQEIDANANGILFIVNDNGVLIGCLTDGDIRRFLLSGGRLDDKAIDAANKNPKVAYGLEEAKVLYHKKNYIMIPVIDNNGQIIDLFNGERTSIKARNPLHTPVVINAGGKGTRLEPYTKILPKPLIPVGELPIIELIMKEYLSYACNEFHIIVNYKKELIKAYFADNENHYNISWYDEKKPLGTGGGLSLLKKKLDSTFFFANCDALLTANYERVLEFHKENRNVITMICAYKNMTIPYGVVDIGINGKIEGMTEKPSMTFLTNTGIYLVEPEVIDDIDDDVSIGFPDIVERQRQKGKKVAAFPVSENDWMDMGQLHELNKMRTKLYGE